MQSTACVTKLLWAALVLSSLAIPAHAQRQEGRVAAGKERDKGAANRAPDIQPITLSRSEITQWCPWRTSGNDCTEDGDCVIQVAVAATDPDGDALSYEYRVSWGTVEAEGQKASWNLRRAPPGDYTITVKVKDARGTVKTKSARVIVVPPICCLPPCITLVVTCPEEAKEGESTVFTANIMGGDADVKPTFNWTVSAGVITRGQGTETIEVDTTGLDGQPLKATVEVGGYPPECAATASCETRVQKKSP